MSVTSTSDRPADVVIDLSGGATERSPAAADSSAEQGGPSQPHTGQARPTAAPARRDRYIDSLRAVALVRMVTYQAFGWIWLPALFPSLGIMFAMAGSLVAASLDRSPANPWRVLAKRVRRLLPPLWAFGIVIVPVMLWHGWTVTDEAGTALSASTLWLWVLPLGDPPGSAWGADWVLPLWYIRAYLWFLLLSPAFLWLFRRWPKRIVALPLLTVALFALGVATEDKPSGEVVLSMGVFGACWLTGFAHHDGTLRRVRRRAVVASGLALMAAGLLWAIAHPNPGPDIHDRPLSAALYSLGFVLILLRFHPDFSWMARRPVLDTLVRMINERAMTIYLWSNGALFCAFPLADSWSVTANRNDGSVGGQLQTFLIAWLCIGVAMVAFGWVEDLAARRPARVNPWPRTAATSPRTASIRVLPWVATVATTAWHARRRLWAGLPRGTAPRLVLGGAGLLLVAAALAWSVAGRGTATHVPANTAPAPAGQPPAARSATSQPAPPRTRTVEPFARHAQTKTASAAATSRSTSTSSRLRPALAARPLTPVRKAPSSSPATLKGVEAPSTANPTPTSTSNPTPVPTTGSPTTEPPPATDPSPTTPSPTSTTGPTSTPAPTTDPTP